ncbi:MAG: hypothetical protein QXU60_06900 [Sulfolobales archaeon]|uniref:hypothetical protein n=1 Tax=Thermofilum sp. TaxID=1961369 RepID=UPI00316058EE
MPKKEEQKAERDIKDKYEMAVKKAKESGKTVAVLLTTEEQDDHIIRYRLLLRPSGERIIHNMEIVLDDNNIGIQIPLFGNWGDVLNTAEAILNMMSIDKFKEAKELALQLQPNRSKRGGRVEEIE